MTATASLPPHRGGLTNCRLRQPTPSACITAGAPDATVMRSPRQRAALLGGGLDSQHIPMLARHRQACPTGSSDSSARGPLVGLLENARTAACMHLQHACDLDATKELKLKRAMHAAVPADANGHCHVWLGRLGIDAHRWSPLLQPHPSPSFYVHAPHPSLSYMNHVMLRDVVCSCPAGHHEKSKTVHALHFLSRRDLAAEAPAPAAAYPAAGQYSQPVSAQPFRVQPELANKGDPSLQSDTLQGAHCILLLSVRHLRCSSANTEHQSRQGLWPLVHMEHTTSI